MPLEILKNPPRPDHDKEYQILQQNEIVQGLYGNVIITNCFYTTGNEYYTTTSSTTNMN